MKTTIDTGTTYEDIVANECGVEWVCEVAEDGSVIQTLYLWDDQQGNGAKFNPIS